MTRWRRPRCVPLIEDGRVLAYVHTAHPITDAERALITEFRRILTDRHDQEEPDVTEPNPTPTAPAEVDLAAAGVDGWYFILRKLREQKAALAAAEEQAMDKLKEALGDNVDGTLNGRPVVRWLHTAAPRKFDKKALAKDHPDIVAKYTTVGTPGRRFELVDPKDDTR
ncbi:hypothetical protein [Actinomadura terrae]|uniref:hypothetical protein n=1 Tax=Actinomadura terrae TaxID=604353 RepID=UPI001FA6D390|nr:hypothetical protein [Actinomadura terrae]